MSAHHDGCFGCGQANLFGLQLESDGVRGRFFVKQDHQGQRRGEAHDGILATALAEALALAAPPDARVSLLVVELHAPAPVGAFVEVEAGESGRATAQSDGRLVAEARAEFVAGLS